MRERSDGEESPGAYVTECVHCVLSDRPRMFWWLSHREGRDAVT